MIKVPCKDCPDRVVGCHVWCEKYINYTKENEAEKERRRQEVLLETYYKSHASEYMEKKYKWRKK